MQVSYHGGVALDLYSNFFSTCAAAYPTYRKRLGEVGMGKYPFKRVFVFEAHVSVRSNF